MDKLKAFFDSAWGFITNFMQMVTLWDVLDIIIIAYFIYMLITFVRKSNSAKVAKGILLLIAALFLSSLMHLNVVSYLLSKAFEVGVFALIVIFQPELRRVLEQVGSSKLTGIIGKQGGTHSVENALTQVVLACSDMSESRTGALIVFERDISLESYIKTGTVIDSIPVAELIKNIFYDKTPLHDGAVIIRAGRVAGAACMLPLSANTNISRALGMRHRAGIGISERSDAVVVIVSEESGAISVAMEGMLKRGLTPVTLEKLLRIELLPKEPEKKGFFDRFKKKRNSGE